MDPPSLALRLQVLASSLPLDEAEVYWQCSTLHCQYTPVASIATCSTPFCVRQSANPFQIFGETIKFSTVCSPWSLNFNATSCKFLAMSMPAQFGNFTVNPVFNERGNQCAGHSANTQCFKRGRIKTPPVKFDDRGHAQTYFWDLASP